MPNSSAIMAKPPSNSTVSLSVEIQSVFKNNRKKTIQQSLKPGCEPQNSTCNGQYKTDMKETN